MTIMVPAQHANGVRLLLGLGEPWDIHFLSPETAKLLMYVLACGLSRIC